MAAFCVHCGAEVPHGAKFCPSCGSAATTPDVWTQPATAAGTERDRRSWFERHKVLSVLGMMTLGLFVIVVLASLGGNDEPPNGALASDPPTETADNTRLFPGRVDTQPEDQERNVGESATVNGVEATVGVARFQQSISDFESDGYIVADVALRNTGDRTGRYSYFDWKIQTPAGEVQDASISGTDGALGSADLVAGGTTSGKIFYTVGAIKGDYYLIWKPNAFDAARGVWKVTI